MEHLQKEVGPADDLAADGCLYYKPSIRYGGRNTFQTNFDIMKGNYISHKQRELRDL